MATKDPSTKAATTSSLRRLTEEQARQLLEAIRWPNGTRCAFCQGANCVALKGASTRAGVYKCRDCRKPFTVTVGTVMERSRVAMWQWVYAFAALSSSKKGLSAHQLRRELGVTYKTAYFMCQRVRFGLKHGTSEPKLTGPVVEADELHVGGKPRNPGEVKKKTTVVVLLEREGRSRGMVTTDVTKDNVSEFVMMNADLSATLMTDESPLYTAVGKKFGRHGTVKHSAREYARGDAHNNTVESWNSLFARGLYGSFHSVSPEHLHFYVSEFLHKWDTRKMSDTERAFDAMARTEGKRLFYRKPKCVIEAGSHVAGPRAPKPPDGQDQAAGAQPVG